MTVFFDQYIQDDIDAPRMTGVAAINAIHTVSEDAASASTRDRAIGLLTGKQIDRVEFIHRPGRRGCREYRGAVFYDTSSPHPKPYLHALNALLGYNGSGPLLSHALMTHLGMSETMFDRMNEGVMGIRSTNQPYVILVVNIGDEWLHDIVQPYMRNKE